MRVALVSTWPPMQCGIGNYTRLLATALRQAASDLELHIITEKRPGIEFREEDGLRVHPVYLRDSDYRRDILAKLETLNVQAVHFQHAPDLLGEDHRLPELLGALRSRGMAGVVTMHTVYGARPWRRLLLKHDTAWFHSQLAANASAIVVHQEAMRGSLLEQGVPDGLIRSIPHGTVLLETGKYETEAAAALRQELGVDPDELLYLFFGFIHIQKNLHTVVRAFLRHHDKLGKVRLLAAGRPFGGFFYNRAYLAVLKSMARRAGLQERVLFHDFFIPPQRMDAYVAASDVMLLPHRQAYASASGVFHQAAGAAKAVICASGPKFQDAGRILADWPALLPEAGDVSAWGRAMVTLASDSSMRTAVAARMAEYGKDTAWAKVAAKTADLYRHLAAEPR